MQTKLPTRRLWSIAQAAAHRYGYKALGCWWSEHDPSVLKIEAIPQLPVTSATRVVFELLFPHAPGAEVSPPAPEVEDPSKDPTGDEEISRD
jgi:hypothetical protein